MAWAYPGVHKTIGGGATSVAIDTTGVTFIVIVQGGDGSLVNTPPTDSKSNTWTRAVGTAAVAGSVGIWYCVNPTVGAGHTFRASDTSNGSVSVAGFTGTDPTPIGQTNSGVASHVTSQATGTITPLQDNELIIAGVCAAGTGTDTGTSVGGGFTLVDATEGASGVTYGSALAFLIQTSAAAANPTFSWTGDAFASAAIASFKAAAAGGGVTLSVVQTGASVGAGAGDPSWTGVNGDPGTGVATINTADAIGAHTTVAVFLSADVSPYPANTIDHIDMVATATVSGPGTGLEVSFDSTNAITPVGTLYTQELILADVLGWPTVAPTLTAFIQTNGVGEVILTVTEVHLVVTLIGGGGGTDIHSSHLLSCIIGSPCARLFV